MADLRVTLTATIDRAPREGLTMQNASSVNARTELIRQFEDILASEMAKRPQRQAFVNDVPEWVVIERAAMLAAVQAARRARGAAEVAPESVRRAESSAEGHFDYVKKWAIGCADLVLDHTS